MHGQFNGTFWLALIPRILLLCAVCQTLLPILRREQRTIYKVGYGLLLNGILLECVAKVADTLTDAPPALSSSGHVFHIVAAAMVTVPLFLFVVKRLLGWRSRLSPVGTTTKSVTTMNPDGSSTTTSTTTGPATIIIDEGGKITKIVLGPGGKFEKLRSCLRL